jgi:hypothetical protein
MDAKRRRNLIIAIIIVAIIAIIANVLAQQQKRPSYEQIDITPTRILTWFSNDGRAIVQPGISIPLSFFHGLHCLRAKSCSYLFGHQS